MNPQNENDTLPNTDDPAIVPMASLEGPNEGETPPVQPPPVPNYSSYKPPKTLSQRAVMPITIVAILFVIGTIAFVLITSLRQATNTQQGKFTQQTVNLGDIEDATPNTPAMSGQLSVNGGLSVSGAFQVTPNEKPKNPNAGQIFYDKERNALGYFNGTEFVYVQGGSAPAQNIDNSTTTTNTVIINSTTQLAPPSVLLQQDAPGVAQSGNFIVSGTGTVTNLVSDNANINTGDIANLTSASAAIDIGNINTINGDVANIETVNVGTANVETGNLETANIETGNIDTANINLVNTGQIETNGQMLTVNKFEEVPGGVPMTVGRATIGPNEVNAGMGKIATKITTGGTGGPLQSISMYIKQVPYIASAYGGWPLPAPVFTNLEVTLYADDGSYPNRPSNALWTTIVAAEDMSNESWLTIDTDNIPLQPSTSYWVAMRMPYLDNPWGWYGGAFKVSAALQQYENATCSTSEATSNPFSATPCTLSNSGPNVALSYITDPSTGGAGAMLSLSPTGQAAFRNTQDSLNAFKIQDAASGSTVFNVDTFYKRVSIGKAVADHTLDVNGDINLANGSPLRFGGRAAVTGNATTTSLSGPNVNVQSGTFRVQSADGSSTYLTIASGGAATFAGPATFSGATTLNGATTLAGATTATNTLTSRMNSTTAFRIQNASSVDLFAANTSNMTITISGSDATFASLTLTNAHFKSTQTTAPTISAPTSCGAGATATVTAGSTDSAGSFTITTGTDSSASACNATLTFRRAYGTAPKSIIVVGKGTAAAAQRNVYVPAATATTFSVSFANSAAGANDTAYEFSYWVIE